MRVLLAGANAAVVGGAESYLRTVAPAIRRAGHEIAYLHERDPAAGKPEVRASEDVPRWTVAGAGADGALARVRRWRPDVSYVHELASPDLEARLLEVAPAVLFAHSYYGTCETGTKRHAFPGIRFCERRLGPGCLLLHYPRRCGGLHPGRMLRSYRVQRRRLRQLKRYRAVCVASRHMAREYRRHDVAEDRLHVLPLPPTGIARDPEPPATRAPEGRLLLAGRLTALKGGRTLLDAIPAAARRLGRSLHLTVAGEGPEVGALRERANALGIACEFAGWLDAEERNARFRAADLNVMPSLWPEPWGLVGLEAACVGLPTAAFAAGGIPDWLESGVNGELAPASPPTPAGLADALVRALSDPTHYEQLRRGAWDRAGRFTIEGHLERLLPILRDAAG